jgi:peptidoglycan/LPS O-acetylase OafA/YrhL
MTIDVAQKQPRTTPPAATIPTRSPHYFPEVDGIRAIAVLMVMFCHAKLMGFAGGFVGVDIFFVISGYVVTLAIVRQQAGGGFSLSEFYARRLRRLLPSLYTVALATLAFCLVFSFPENNLKLLRNLTALTLFGSNYYLAKQTGYFDLESAKQPLLHTWSLSVEEQFYLILPLCLVFLGRFKPRTRAIALCVAFVLALAYSIVQTNKVGASGYYFLPARLFEFLLGALIALGIARARALPAWLADLLLVLGIAAVWACCVYFGPQTIMPGKSALLPCAAAALLIVGGRHAGALRPLLSNAPLRYLGRISYPLYLWHWPCIFAFNRFGLGDTHWMILALVLSLVLAVLTHHWIEVPWRARKDRPGRTWLMLWLAPVVVVAASTQLARSTDNFTRFYPQQYRNDYKHAGYSVFDVPRARKCWRQAGVTSPADCTLGAADSPTRAVLWGDSHAYQQIGLIDAIGKARHLAIQDMSFTLCAPVENSPEHSPEAIIRNHAQDCRAHNLAVMKHILADPQIKLVFMGAVWDAYANAPGGNAPNARGYIQGQFETELASTIARLNAAGKRVIMLDDIPMLPAELVNCPSDRVYLPAFARRECSYPRAVAEQQHQVAAELLARTVKAFPGTAVINTYDVPCDATRCHAELEGVPLYKHDDAGHLGTGGTAIFYQLYVRKHPGQLDEIFKGN